MKKILFIFLSLVLSINTQAEDLTKKIAETASDYISNLIPGDGTTEVSIQLRENHKPDFSILGVRELNKANNENTFVQFSLFNTEKMNNERYTIGLLHTSYYNY